MKLCCYPVTLKYIFVAFRDDGNNFLSQYLHTRTMDSGGRACVGMGFGV